MQPESCSAIYPYIILFIYRLLMYQASAGREDKTDPEYYLQSRRPTSLFTVPNGYNSIRPVSCVAKTRWFKMSCLRPYSSSHRRDTK
ncbi:hypothetical protein LB507_011682 [Fusarium sp. FIESC RH6]|nr:hypothetical protein LB507_011682 [Fusarium sp. FIESC RH6]